MVFRLATLALLSACLYLMIDARENAEPVLDDAAQPPPSAKPSVQIVDVAHGVSAGTVASLVRLAPGEHVAEINGRQVDDDDEHVRVIALAASDGYYDGATAYPARYVDLTIADGGGSRRVLVLLH